MAIERSGSQRVFDGRFTDLEYLRFGKKCGFMFKELWCLIQIFVTGGQYFTGRSSVALKIQILYLLMAHF
jgi:hypothetical protein